MMTNTEFIQRMTSKVCLQAKAYFSRVDEHWTEQWVKERIRECFTNEELTTNAFAERLDPAHVAKIQECVHTLFQDVYDAVYKAMCEMQKPAHA